MTPLLGSLKCDSRTFFISYSFNISPTVVSGQRDVKTGGERESRDYGPVCSQISETMQFDLICDRSRISATRQHGCASAEFTWRCQAAVDDWQCHGLGRRTFKHKYTIHHADNAAPSLRQTSPRTAAGPICFLFHACPPSLSALSFTYGAIQIIFNFDFRRRLACGVGGRDIDVNRVRRPPWYSAVRKLQSGRAEAARRSTVSAAGLGALRKENRAMQRSRPPPPPPLIQRRFNISRWLFIAP